jgi:uncharacterized membrane protein
VEAFVEPDRDSGIGAGISLNRPFALQAKARRFTPAGFSIATLLVSVNIAVSDDAARVAVMKIVLRVVGPLFVAVGLFWFAQGTGLLTWPHNAAMVDYGAGIIAVGFGLVWLAWR